MKKIRALATVCLLMASVGLPARAAPECGNPCHIEVLGFVYTPPAQVIASGTVVEWTTDDKTHPTSNSPQPEGRCFVAVVGREVPPTPVRFDLNAGVVTATSDIGLPTETTEVCGNTMALPDGGTLLPFQCLLHAWMHGGLEITA